MCDIISTTSLGPKDSASVLGREWKDQGKRTWIRKGTTYNTQVEGRVRKETPAGKWGEQATWDSVLGMNCHSLAELHLHGPALSSLQGSTAPGL